MRFVMYFRRGIECRFPFFDYTCSFRKTSVFIVAHSPRTVAKRVGDSRVPRAYVAFHDNSRHINNTYYEKTVRVSEKWKPAFNSSSKIHKELHILDPDFFLAVVQCYSKNRKLLAMFTSSNFKIVPFFLENEPNTKLVNSSVLCTELPFYADKNQKMKIM